MASETDRVAQWLYGLLSADGTLAPLIGTRIYEFLAPQGTAYPYVVFHPVAPRDVNSIGSGRVMVGGTWDVMAYDQSRSYTTLTAIASRIDVLLQGARTSQSWGYIFAAVREEPRKTLELIEGLQVRGLGGTYRINVQEH